MDINRHEEIGRIAEKISFAFEDQFDNKNKRDMFHALFDRFLSPVDPGGQMETYDAIISLWRKNPGEFEQMVREMKENKLISW